MQGNIDNTSGTEIQVLSGVMLLLAQALLWVVCCAAVLSAVMWHLSGDLWSTELQLQDDTYQLKCCQTCKQRLETSWRLIVPAFLYYYVFFVFIFPNTVGMFFASGISLIELVIS